MISFAGLGEAFGAGDVNGEPAGVGAVLGETITSGVDGVASGALVACWLGRVQPANTKTNPAAHAAGKDPAHTLF
jgi:hypothetical protein